MKNLKEKIAWLVLIYTAGINANKSSGASCVHVTQKTASFVFN